MKNHPQVMTNSVATPKSKHYRIMVYYTCVFLVLASLYMTNLYGVKQGNQNSTAMSNGNRKTSVTEEITVKEEVRKYHYTEEGNGGINLVKENMKKLVGSHPILEGMQFQGPISKEDIPPPKPIDQPPVLPVTTDVDVNTEVETVMPINHDEQAQFFGSSPVTDPLNLQKSDIVKLVAIGIKTFNRPSCALNLMKSILYFFPGISIFIVNDGLDPIPITGGIWSLRRPLEFNEKDSNGAMASIKILVSNTTSTLNDPLSFNYENRDQYLEKVPDIDGSGEYPVSYIHQIMIPFDSGVSLGRNVLVHACNKKYILMTDDDYQFTEETDLLLMARMLEQSEVSSSEAPAKKLLKHPGVIDVVGGIRSEGKLSNLGDFPRGSNFDIVTEAFSHLPKNYVAQGKHYFEQSVSNFGTKEPGITLLRIFPQRDDATPDTFGENDDLGTEPLASLMMMGNCLPVDFIQQFFMVRVDKLRYVDDDTPPTLWDPYLKNNDHYDFFLRAAGLVKSDVTKPTKALNIVGCTNVKFIHAKTTSNVCSAESSLKTPSATTDLVSYKDFRSRWIRYIPYLFKKWNIGLLADDELNKLVMIVKDKLENDLCKVLQVRRGYTVSESFDFSCESLKSISGNLIESRDAEHPLTEQDKKK